MDVDAKDADEGYATDRSFREQIVLSRQTSRIWDSRMSLQTPPSPLLDSAKDS